jgi:hypothetical protein
MHAIDWLPDGCCSKSQQASLDRPHLSSVAARTRRAIKPTSEMVPQSNNQLCKIMFKFSTFLFLSAVLPVSATVLTTLPSPMIQGTGMIHVNVAFNGSALEVLVDPGTPVIKPLSAWMPGDSFDPASPWYATLDPSEAAGLFNSQFGFVVSAQSELLPANSTIIVGWVSGTAGLESFRWRNTPAPQLFDPILGADGTSTSWDWGTVNRSMMHPLFTMPAGSSGTASATLSFTLADSSGVALTGYTPAQTTLNFNVIPEPSAWVLSMFTGLLVLRRNRSKASVS